MNAYTWQFPALEAYPTYEGLTDAVFSMHWRLTANDGAGHTAEIYGEQRTGPIDPADFIPFADLTKAEVQGWLETELGADVVANMKTGLDAAIANQINPPTVTLAPPWPG